MKLLKNKRLLIPGALILVIILVSIFFYPYMDIPLVNPHIQIEGFRLLDKEEKWKDTISKEFTNIGLFGGRGFVNEKKGIEITFTGFPDIIDRFAGLTSIVTTNPAHSVYGVRVGDEVDKAAEILNKKGFRLEKESNYYILRRNIVSIILNFDENQRITKLCVSVRVTNKHKVQF